VPDIIELLSKDEKFKSFTYKIDKNILIRDATYFLRKDGIFFFSEGYFHYPAFEFEERKVITHLIYTPAIGNVPETSKKIIFGQEYENITKEIMLNNPVHMFYPLQLKRYLKEDSSLDTDKPVFAKYKVLVPLKDMIGCYPPRHSLKKIMERADIDKDAKKIKIITEKMAELLSIPIDNIGISGSVALGTYNNPHDLDYVIFGSLKDIRRITDYIYSLTRKDENRKVYEFGKFWPLRYWEKVGSEKFMVCPFFSYLNIEEIPLYDFEMEVLKDIEVTGKVKDHTHNCFNPTILEMTEVTEASFTYPDMKLIIYHGGGRGDYVEGNSLKIRGTLVKVITYKTKEGKREKFQEYEAILVTNFDQIDLIV